MGSAVTWWAVSSCTPSLDVATSDSVRRAFSGRGFGGMKVAYTALQGYGSKNSSQGYAGFGLYFSFARVPFWVAVFSPHPQAYICGA